MPHPDEEPVLVVLRDPKVIPKDLDGYVTLQHRVAR
jgi:hypothetical protein